jgi:hypothetical protein
MSASAGVPFLCGVRSLFGMLQLQHQVQGLAADLAAADADAKAAPLEAATATEKVSERCVMQYVWWIGWAPVQMYAMYGVGCLRGMHSCLSCHCCHMLPSEVLRETLRRPCQQPADVCWHLLYACTPSTNAAAAAVHRPSRSGKTLRRPCQQSAPSALYPQR